jgi:hypothetical protein
MLQVLTVTTHCSTRNSLSSPTAICAGSLEQSMGARNQVGIGLSYRRPTRAGIFKQSMGTRGRVGIGLSYRPARAEIFNFYGAQESIPTNQFRQAVLPGGPDYNPIPTRFLAPINCLKIPAQAT